MSAILPHQHRYNFKIGGVDATDFIDGDVTLEIDVMKMAHLSFSIRNPDLNSEWLQIGRSVDFMGGYLQVPIRANTDYLAESKRFKKLFTGKIKTCNLAYKEDGTELAVIEALDTSWSIYGEYGKYRFRYPSYNCPRDIGNTNRVKLQDIVKYIIEKELGCTSNINLGDGVDIEYTLAEPVVQYDMSDWAFLRYLAKRCDCYCWTSIEGSNTVVNFVNKSKAISDTGRMEFVWIGRGGSDERNFFNAYGDTNSAAQSTDWKGSYLRESSIGRSDDSKLKENQIQLRTVAIQESPSLYGSLVHQITDFDTETGETKNQFVMYDETKEELIYYELNREKIDAMQRTPEGAKTLKQIQAMGAFGIPWEVAKDYYIPRPISKAIIDAIDKPLLGVTITATCDMNVDITPQQSYLVHGVSRYSSTRNKSRRYFLKTMSHIWSDNGADTKLEFVC